MTSFLKNKKAGLLILFSIFYFLFAVPVYAQEVNELMINLVEGTPVLPQADLIGIIFRIIQYVLMFVGVVALVIIIYGGFLWMTAKGNDEQVNKAKKVLTNGLIGLVVVLLSYAIVSFAIGKVEEISRPPGSVCTPNQCVSGCWRCNNQGNGTIYDVSCPPCGTPPDQFVIRWTWPRNGQEGVTVCALLQAGFNNELDEDTVNEDNIRITLRDALGSEGDDCLTNVDCKSGKCQLGFCLGDTVAGEFIVVNDVFKFNAEVDFEKEQWYKWIITTGVRNIHGRNLSAQRIIEFKTSSEEDTTPPTVENVYPENGQENVCLLDPIQVVFSEAMDATTLLNIEALITDPIHEFRRSALNEKTLEATPKTSYRSFQEYQAILNADIIADVCGNKLDGNKDGKAEGSPIDDYDWSFTTGDTLYCEPIINSIEPTSGYYNDELIIRGNYFKLTGDVIFNRQVYPNDFCFNNRLFPNQTCLLSWTNNEIRIKIPAAGGASQGTVSGPVRVVVGAIPSNSQYFNLQSPYLQSFTPSYGGRDQAITLSGINFGNVEGKVYFIPENNLDSKIEGALICEEAGWHDYEIIVAVPQFIDLGNHYLQVERADGKYSNVRLDEMFEITDQEPGPTLCDIKPYCPNGNMRGGKPDDARILDGHRFGTAQGLVNFNSISAQVSAWDENEINIVVPQINPATYQVRVVLPNFKESNPVTFISPCFEQGNFADPCFLNETTCLLEKCAQPYECKSSTNGSLECRCCCNKDNGCPAPLECDETQLCYRSREIEITGACCGCTSTDQCSNNEICKQQGEEDPFCCFACGTEDDGQACKGGQCCSKDCGGFVTEGECLRHNGCSWNNLTCSGGYDPYCCRNGRCIDHQCLSLCGNGQIDPGEDCDPGPPENLNNTTCQILGYEGGTLHCDGLCRFDTVDCIGGGGDGQWGEICKEQSLSCYLGRDNCNNAEGARCVKNEPTAECACCCQEADPEQGITDSCKEINNKLTCSLEKPCGNFTPQQKGLCCGCQQDEDCYSGPPYVGLACWTDKCCYPLPVPKQLTFLSGTTDQIKLSWVYKDDKELGTHFEVYKKDPGENDFILLTACNVTTKECDLEKARLVLIDPSLGLYNFFDERGNFIKSENYSYRIRTKKGTTTAYSYWALPDPIIGKITGTTSCQKNEDCPNSAPCCRTDTNICVDWANCQGNCQEGGRCFRPAVKFAVHDFLVTNRQIGPCLIGINPTKGCSIVTEISLTGLRFTITGPPTNNVTFAQAEGGRINALYSSPLTWTDKKIEYAIVPMEATDGEVKVVAGNLESNGRWFDHQICPVPPGELCYLQGNECQMHAGSCSDPYLCLHEEPPEPGDCRCCCNPSASPDDCQIINERLKCYANQGKCTGDIRGLCCGCLNDNDCGNLIMSGCAMLESDPKCCYSRPTWKGLAFCDNTLPSEVKVNSDIILIFNEEMNFGSLNKDNLKVSRAGNCLSIEEGTTINNRCYLNGSIVSKNEDGQTETIFSPKLCQFQTSTTYQVEIVVDIDGRGVKSAKGVSLNNFDQPCSWDYDKKCQIKYFTTINDPNDLCEIQWVDVQPRNASVRELNKTVEYQGIARDASNRAVCIKEFQWQSIDEIGENVAEVITPGKITTATSKAVGLARIVARIPPLGQAPTKTCDTVPHTCGLLNVSLEGPKVIKQQTCDVCGEGQSPSPWQFSTNACLDAKIVARFDKMINPISLNENTIKVKQCWGTEFNKPECEWGEKVKGIITPFINKKGFYFQPVNDKLEPIPLLDNKIHHVTLVSGINGIKDTDGLQLDGNSNGIQDGSPNDDFVWFFKTKDDDVCPLTKVCIQAEKEKIVHPGTAKFEGLIYTQNCNYLDADDYDWQWSSSKTDVATVSPVSPDPLTTASSVGLGITKIKGVAQGKTDEAELIVATVPFVEETYPSGSGFCLNTAIWSLFDQKMDQNSFPGNFKVEKESDVPGPLWFDVTSVPGPLWFDVTSDFSAKFILENGQTKVYFVPKSFLEKNKKYQVTILEEVKSIQPYETEMASQKTWMFTTGEIYCLLEKVKVEPIEYLFTRAKDTKDFLAKAFYRDTEIQGIPDWYDWTWDDPADPKDGWQSTNSKVVAITNSNNPLQRAESQPQNGLANINAQAKITVDEIFRPNTVGKITKGSAQVEVWLCENPWPCIDFPNCQVYQDNKTNFSFRYCRDAGASGLIGDLPILKGGSITGGSEPGLEKLGEHFFSVYDGSLSFLFNSGPIITYVKTGKRYLTNKSGYNNNLYNIFGNNNGLINGNSPMIVGGKFGQAFSFDGSNYLSVNFDGVPVGRNATIEPEKFTLETWIKTDKRNLSQYIFRKSSEIDLSDGYGLEVRDDGKAYFWVVDQTGNKVEISVDLNLPVSGILPVWNHLAATYDSKVLKLYLNGVDPNSNQIISTPAGGIKQSGSDLIVGSNFIGVLDEIALWQKVLSQAEIAEHLQAPPEPTLGDVIGFKVFSNYSHLTSDEWCRKNAPGCDLSGGTGGVVDNYQSYQVGRTVYVTATNVDVSLVLPKIYTNAYLISQSDNPQAQTSQIFRQSINNWKFNTNIDDPEDKFKLVRDLRRIYDFKTIWQTLEEYKDINSKEPNLYPRLEDGSYIKGMSVSKWPSWTTQTGLGQDLVRAGLSPLPNDPVNKFSLKSGCGGLATPYACCADCPRNNPDCTQTCYNPQLDKYEGVNPCQIYQYMTEGNPVGKSYGLYTNFEYPEGSLYPADNWQHQCEILGLTACQTNPFCYWKLGGITSYLSDRFVIAQTSGSCQKKWFYYSGNPCEKNGNDCACFNTRFSSIIASPPPPAPGITFSAYPTYVPEGGTTTLTWNVKDAVQCTASATPENLQWQGEISNTGKKDINNIQERFVFNLDCIGLGGKAHAQVEVSVIRVPDNILNVRSYPITGLDITGVPAGKTNYSSSSSDDMVASLTAPASSGNYIFSNWTGCDSVVNRDCFVRVSGGGVTKTVTANYNSINVTP